MIELTPYAGRVLTLQQLRLLAQKRAHVPPRWRAQGHLAELFPGQHLIGHGPPSWKQLAIAALQWGGKGAALCLGSAAAVLGFEGFARGAPLHLAIRGRAKPPTAPAIELELHTGHVYGEWDVKEVDGLRVTSVERTLVDLAGVMDPTEHEQVVEAVIESGATRTNKLKACFDRLAKKGTRGVGPMRALLARRGWTMTRVDSHLEKRFAAMFKDQDLPPPTARHWWPEKGQPLRRIDFAYRKQLLAIEIDSHRFHSARDQWADDVARNNLLVADGWSILHLTEEHLHRPKNTARLILEALYTRGYEPPRPPR